MEKVWKTLGMGRFLLWERGVENFYYKRKRGKFWCGGRFCVFGLIAGGTWGGYF